MLPVRWGLASSVTKLFQPTHEKKRPLIRVDGHKQRWVAILMEGIHQKAMLPLPVFATERLGFQSLCREGSIAAAIPIAPETVK